MTHNPGSNSALMLVDSDPVRKVLAQLPGAKRSGKSYSARCPAHEDRNASLSITGGDDGRVLLKCHAGCSNEAIVAAIGLKLSDLFPPRNDRRVARANKGASVGQIVARYDYHNAEGDLVYQVLRYTPKNFRQRQPDPSGGWIWNMQGVERVLYRLGELRESDPAEWCYIVEGEKDVDRIVEAGGVATTGVGGAGKWQSQYNEHFRDRRVCIIADKDEPGRKHVQQVAAAIAPLAADVRIVELPGNGVKDASDWFAVGGDLQQLNSIADVAVKAESARSHPTAVEVKAGNGCSANVANVPADFPLTDAGNGERLMHEHGGKLKWIELWKRWVVFDSTRWVQDGTGAADRLALATVRALKHSAAEMAEAEDDDKHAAGMKLLKYAHCCESRKRLRDMLACAATVEGATITPDTLDRDPDLLNVANGTLDLRTGTLRKHDSSDYITKMSPVHYNATATCPTWLNFLERIFDGNDQLVGFMQRAAGYSLTALTIERVLFILYGSGANGKSTFIGALRHVFGDYAMSIAADTLMVKKNEGISNDIARLKGQRFVAATESDEGRRMAEGLVKTMAGGEDVLTARFMRAEFFDFKPTFKLWLATNHRPDIRGTDPAIWDRIRLVPFNVRIPDDERDKTLASKLEAESPGILNWCLQGCRDWRKQGLGMPAEVADATAEYKADNDKLATFIASDCVVGPAVHCIAGELFDRYLTWCHLYREEPMNLTKFGRQLSERGFGKEKDSKSNCVKRLGIGLRASE